MTPNINGSYPPEFIHTLLSEYTHSLDSLPLELSKNFADLRELDAVLSSSAAAITTKINGLIDLLENKEVPPATRLFLLKEIADEASRLKLGGDDKIRVASQAADNLRSYETQLNGILRHCSILDPALSPARLSTKTTYPHVSPNALVDPVPNEGGRRKRVFAGGNKSIGGYIIESPAKKKKVPRDDDDTNSRRLERDAGNGRPRENGDKTKSLPRTNKKQEGQRAPSPAESIVSITSSRPPAPGPSNRPATTPKPRRTAPPQNGTPRETANLMDQVASRNKDAHLNGSQQGPPSPSAHHNGHSAVDNHGNSPYPAETEVGEQTEEADDGGEGDGADDLKKYCICQTVSFGEMIGCDDPECETEWFHLVCMGLTAVPKGAWFCDNCKTRRGKRSRAGKKKPAARGKGGRGAQ